MPLTEIVEFVLSESHLKENDYFDTSIFYYLSGRYPDLTINECVRIVDLIRSKMGFK